MGTETTAIDELFRDCLAVRVRLIGRAVSAVYDRAVEPDGLTIAQVNLLAALGKAGACSPSRLGALLQLERSTVSRNLDRLLDAGWIEAVSSDAKGVKDVALTPAGRHKIESVMPHWRAAQQEAATLLGAAGVQAVRSIADRVWRGPGDRRHDSQPM
jgi:DNA-binding MarR family transcriptional regulator